MTSTKYLTFLILRPAFYSTMFMCIWGIFTPTPSVRTSYMEASKGWTEGRTRRTDRERNLCASSRKLCSDAPLTLACCLPPFHLAPLLQNILNYILGPPGWRANGQAVAAFAARYESLFGAVNRESLKQGTMRT